MLTRLRVKNFKRLEDVEIELGPAVVFVGPNNSGKTTALQALALWEGGLARCWEEHQRGHTWIDREGVSINRRDLVAVPVPNAHSLWFDLDVGAPDLSLPPVSIEIEVFGEDAGKQWSCGFSFQYVNAESVQCFLRSETNDHLSAAAKVRLAFLPPMSGLAATEDLLTGGSIDVRIGEGRTAEVLRNLCYRISEAEDERWRKLEAHILALFGVLLRRPEFVRGRGEITMSYVIPGGTELDLTSSGRGMQQTLLLLAHLYGHPGTVLLLDEPDAHLEILRQRQIYQLLTDTAREQDCQLIVATHSEVLLNEAADRDVVVAFVGRNPHRIDDRGSQVLKALKSIGFEHYYQAEQTGWVLYLEGATDLAILRGFAKLLNHPAQKLLAKPFVKYVGNVRMDSRNHFYGLREAKRDLAGLAIYDSGAEDSSMDEALVESSWKQNEIENYFCFRETLLAYADSAGSAGAMEESIEEVTAALRTLGKPDPFGKEIKASDDFLTPVFAKYFEKLSLQNWMQKTDFHTLVPFVPAKLLDPEIEKKLDLIVATAARARSAGDGD